MFYASQKKKTHNGEVGSSHQPRPTSKGKEQTVWRLSLAVSLVVTGGAGKAAVEKKKKGENSMRLGRRRG